MYRAHIHRYTYRALARTVNVHSEEHLVPVRLRKEKT